MPVQQVAPWDVWPSGDGQPIAVLPFDRPERTERYRLAWHEGTDDLGHYHLAAIELAKGIQAWLVSHDTDPNPGTVVYADAAADVVEAQSLLMRALGLAFQDLLWAASAQAQNSIARTG